MNKSLNLLKEIIAKAELKGKITVQNDGSYIAKFEVNYLIGNVQLAQTSGRIYEGQQQSVYTPRLANKVKIKIKELITKSPEIWKTIVKLEYPYAGTRNFRLWGNNLNAKYGILNTVEQYKTQKENL